MEQGEGNRGSMADPLGWPDKYTSPPPSLLRVSIVKANASYFLAFPASLAGRGGHMTQVWPMKQAAGGQAEGSGKAFVSE